MKRNPLLLRNIDATIALAERIAGTEETFAQLMNANAKRLGMRRLGDKGTGP